MLGVTTYLSVDIAAVPLLWVVPLTIYLLTFVLAFSTRPWISQAVLRRLLPILALTLLALILRDATQPSWLVVPMHLIVFFVAAQVCHGELAGDRPSASGLTGFYLWISVGGVLGGLFNSIIAPLVFTGVVEYPLALIAACALLPPRAASRKASGFRASGFRIIEWGSSARPRDVAVCQCRLKQGMLRTLILKPEAEA